MKFRRLTGLSMLPVLLGGCALIGGGSAIPDRIVIERGGFIPEGIEFDTTARRFLSGSLVDGTIYEIGNDGSLTAFVEDSELVSSVGIEADEPRDRLLVANADRSVFHGDGDAENEQRCQIVEPQTQRRAAGQRQPGESGRRGGGGLAGSVRT
jgi:hypothetical protein